MLAFVTTIRHPSNSNSFERVGRLLDATLRSVCRQTDPAYHVLVVHNEMPPISFSDPHVSEIRVGFPPPSEERKSQIEYGAFRRDKGTKCIIGAIAARELGASHVMFIDADDLMHHGLAEFVNRHPDHPGWYSPRGFVHSAGSRSVQRIEDDFHRKNGSTGIIRSDLLDIPAELTVDSSQEDIFRAMSERRVARMFGDHGKWEEDLLHRGYTMEALPFPSAIWEIGTGENHSGNLVSARSSEPIGEAITEMFGLQSPSWWSSALQSARIQSVRLRRRVNGPRSKE